MVTYKGRSINKLQNSIIVLVFKILEIQFNSE